MGTFGKCLGGGRRSSDRVSAPLVAVYTTVTKTHRVSLVDVSTSGAKLTGDFLPDEGEEMFVSFGALRAFGQVIWSDCGQFGVAFDPPLSSLDVHLLQTRGAQGLGLSAEMKAALDVWMAGAAR